MKKVAEEYRSFERKRDSLFARLFFCCTAAIIALVLFIRPAFCFPDAEVLGAGAVEPPFDFDITSEVSGFALITDSLLAVSFASTLKLVDLNNYTTEVIQPAPLSSDDGTDGIISDIFYSSARDEIIMTQQDGDIIIYSVPRISETPVSVTIADGNVLGPVVVDDLGLYAYISDNTARRIYVYNLDESKITATISLSITGSTSFNITDAVYVADNETAYFTTDVGTLLYASKGSTGASYLQVGSGLNLNSLAVFPNDSALYLVDATTPQLVRVATASNTITATGIDISENEDPEQITITAVTNPSANYAYVSGKRGVSIINCADDFVLDMGTDPNKDAEPLETSSSPIFLADSSSTDGYVYMSLSNTKVGILTENPWITISSLAYLGGGTSLGIGGTFTLTFKSDAAGTYEIICGGGPTANGDLLVDVYGSTSGVISADSDLALTFAYDDNSSAFDEGSNDLFMFVTDSSNIRGRRSTFLQVDTPPPAVTVAGTQYGNGRIYVIIDRLTESDISEYNFYVAKDPVTPLSMTTPTLQMAQASSGATQTADISGLINGTLYYAAVEAVDFADNVSPSRTLTSETPSLTVGPVGLAGEKGCSLATGASRQGGAMHIIFVLAAIALPALMRGRIRFLAQFLLVAVVLQGGVLWAEETPSVGSPQLSTIEEKNIGKVDLHQESKQMWEFELKTGFWLPKSSVLKQSFGNCCNMITRVEGGFLYEKKYGVGIGAGFLYKSGNAVGTGSQGGQASGDKYKFMFFPFQLNFTWRADYFDWRYLVPYARVGLDAVVFRESITGGATTKGVKYGMHGGGGVMLNAGLISNVRKDLDWDFGINDFFVTLEGMYQQINTFGRKGLNLSGPVFSIGFLFEF